MESKNWHTSRRKKIDLQKTFCFWHSRSILTVKTEGKWGFGWGPGREAPPGSRPLQRSWPRGGRAESFRFLFLRIKVLRFKGLKDWRIQKMNHTRQTEKSKNRRTDWLNELNAWRIENSLKKSYDGKRSPVRWTFLKARWGKKTNNMNTLIDLQCSPWCYSYYFILLKEKRNRARRD